MRLARARVRRDDRHMNRIAPPLALLLAACAARPEIVPATLESPLRYASADCEALEARAAMLDARIADVAAAQDAIARDDEIAGAVGFLMSPAFWIVPAYKDNPAAELAALKGDRRAVALVAEESRCDLAS